MYDQKAKAAEGLRFRFDLEKLIHALAYLAAKRVKGLTKLKAVKLLYLADQRHLLEHGRPIIGDRYVAMDYGPVPENAYQLVSRLIGPDEVKDETSAQASKVLGLYRGRLRTYKYPLIIAKSNPDLDVFSDSEIAALNDTVINYGELSASDLVDLTHKHSASKIADRCREKGSSVSLPYELFFEDAPSPTREAVRTTARRYQDDLDFAEELRKAGRAALV